MAQAGKPGILTSIPITELGSLSGPGGIIGGVIDGYQYFPLKDEMNFEDTIAILVIDKITTISNLPNRTNPNNVENQTHVIDMYIGIKLDPESEDLNFNIVNEEVVYIPSHYITQVQGLPGLDCCDPVEINIDGDGGGNGGNGGNGGTNGNGGGSPFAPELDISPDIDFGVYDFTVS